MEKRVREKKMCNLCVLLFQDGITENDYVTELRAGFLPITQRKSSMNMFAPATCVSDIDC